MSGVQFLSRALVAGALVVLGASTADAQRAPRVVQAAEPAPSSSREGTPYPGATVFIEPGWYGRETPRAPIPGPMRRHQVPATYYYPVPVLYPAYQPVGYVGGGVYDTNGRPLTSSFDTPPMAQGGYVVGTPDLSGSPYVAVDGGAMVVDFGNGDRRTISSCAVASATVTPDGQSRTVFYRPAPDALILRAGQRGRVIGAPPAGAWSCYRADQWGRTVLAY